jgi:hypothetical protein
VYKLAVLYRPDLRDRRAFDFVSPIHRSHFTALVFPGTGTEVPETVDALVEKAVKNLSASTLQDLHLLTDNICEASMQHEFIVAAIKVLPPKNRPLVHGSKGFTRETEGNATQVTEHVQGPGGQKGNYDVFINRHLQWLLEFFMAGRGELYRVEHVERCMPGGRYHDAIRPRAARAIEFFRPGQHQKDLLPFPYVAVRFGAGFLTVDVAWLAEDGTEKGFTTPLQP